MEVLFQGETCEEGKGESYGGRQYDQSTSDACIKRK
jgi:hypothetical protein